MTDFFNTYINHWLYMCSLTNLLSKKPYTTPLVLFDICHLGSVVGGLRYLKRCLQVLLFSLPAVLSCLLIHCLLTFLLFHTAQEPGSGWSFQWWLFIETSIGDWVGRGERAECKDLGKCKNTSCVSPLPSHSRLPPLFQLQNFKHCCVFSSYYFPTLSTLLEPLATLSSPTFRTCPAPMSWAWASETMSSPT